MHHALIRATALSVLLAAPLTPLSTAWAIDGDATAGKTAFNQCAACQAVQAGQNKVAPTMHGVVGRKAASVPGYSYSPAMQKYDVTLPDEELDKYLADPKGAVPGTKMVFPGLKNETERKNVIAYLDTLK